jgi:hypothetical protein
MAGDSISQQKEIFGKVQSLMAFLDTTEQNKKRENLEEWKEVLESLRNITSNPLPFLLELLKNVQIGKNTKKKYAEARAMRAAKKKKRKGTTGDADFKETPKNFLQKFNLDTSANPWLRQLNSIIRESVMSVLPRVEDILLEEIIKAFSCDLSMLVPVVGDGITNPTGLVIKVSEIDLLKQLFSDAGDPNDPVSQYFYERDMLNPGNYPPGQSKFPVNRFLRELIFNNGGIFTTPGSHQTVYGQSGRALFDVKSVGNGLLEIYPYYKDQPGPNYLSAPGVGVSPTGNWPAGPIGGAVKFNFIEYLTDYFHNIKLIELQNLLGALMEVLTGFMSVRNESMSIEDLLGLNKFLSWVENVLASCDGADLNELNTETASHLSEIYDEDNFYSFTVEEERIISLETKRKSQNVISFESCGIIDIPVDVSVIDEGVAEILASQTLDEQLKAFDLVLQKFAAVSATQHGYDLTLGNISVPVEIDFKENLIKKLPQILMYSIMNPKGVLPIVLVYKMLNQNGTLGSTIDAFAQIFKRVLIRVIKEILNEISKRILALLKVVLLRLIRKMIKEKMSEKNKKKIAIIRKLLDILLPLIIALQEAENCKEILDALLAVLLANMPDIPFGVPPFLVMAAKLRPGTSALGTFERLINKLQSRGIPVGDMPDGSPNTFLLSQLALIQAKEDEDSENGIVQTAIINGQVMVAPGGGVGQIVPGTTAYGIPG